MSSKTTLIRVFRVELRGTKQNRSGSGQKKGFWEAPFIGINLISEGQTMNIFQEQSKIVVII